MSATQIDRLETHFEVEALARCAAQGYRPNVLVVVHVVSAESLLGQLLTLCTPPIHGACLPGALQLPRARSGTLLLNDVAALTPSQQTALNEWIELRPDIQVVSVAAAPLDTLVAHGNFDSTLFYRLNVLRWNI